MVAQGGHARPGHDLIRKQLERLQIALLGFGQPTQPLQRLPPVGVRLRVARFERQRRVERLQRLLGPLQAKQAPGEGVSDGGVGWLQRHRPAQVWQGLLQTAARLQRHGQHAEQHGMLGSRLQALFGELAGVVKIPTIERREHGGDARLVLGRVGPRRDIKSWRGGTGDPQPDRARRIGLHQAPETTA